MAKNMLDPFTGSPEIWKKPVFIVVYIYRYTIEIRCPSICKTNIPINTTPNEMKFCGKLPPGPEKVLG